MRRAVTIGLLASCLALAAGCASRPEPSPAPVDRLRLRLGGLERLVLVVRDRARREEFAPTRSADDGWVSPPNMVRLLEGRSGFLHVYPTRVARRFSFEAVPGAIGLVTMTADGTVVGVGEHTLSGGRQTLLPGAPFRLALWVPASWLRGAALDVGQRLPLPEGIARAAEPEFVPIADPPPATVRIGDATLRVEIAHTTRTRACGMMYRDDVPPGEGMLFLYPDRRELRFWMVNTRVDLDVAYVDRDGTIRAIRALNAYDEAGAPSGVPVAGALEVARGWFADHGVAVGDRVVWPARVDVLRDTAEP